MITKIRSIFDRTKASISTFTSNPISNLGFLIPIAIFITSFISGIVSYVIFTLQGGYNEQVGLIKRSGIDGIFDGFTSGTVNMFWSGITAKIILGLVGVEFIVILISYFKNRGKRMRIAMIINLAVFAIMIALSTVIFWIAVGELFFSDEQMHQFSSGVVGITITFRTILIAYSVVLLASVICFVVFILITKECRWMVGYTALSIVIINTVVPLLFWLLQNVIPIVGGILIAVILLAVIKFIIWSNSDQPEDIQSKKKELARAQERSENYKASADANFKDARDGLNIIFSAETKREWARDDLKKAEYEGKEIRRLKKDLERLESKYGKQD